MRWLSGVEQGVVDIVRITSRSCFTASSAIFASVSRVMTEPVGLFGVLIIRALGVRCDELFDGLRLHFKVMLQIRGDADRRAVTVCDLRHIVQPLRILNEDFITPCSG